MPVSRLTDERHLFSLDCPIAKTTPAEAGRYGMVRGEIGEKGEDSQCVASR
jgi:hypothetical protein